MRCRMEGCQQAVRGGIHELVMKHGTKTAVSYQPSPLFWLLLPTMLRLSDLAVKLSLGLPSPIISRREEKRLTSERRKRYNLSRREVSRPRRV